MEISVFAAAAARQNAVTAELEPEIIFSHNKEKRAAVLPTRISRYFAVYSAAEAAVEALVFPLEPDLLSSAKNGFTSFPIACGSSPFQLFIFR